MLAKRDFQMGCGVNRKVGLQPPDGHANCLVVSAWSLRPRFAPTGCRQIGLLRLRKARSLRARSDLLRLGRSDLGGGAGICQSDDSGEPASADAENAVAGHDRSDDRSLCIALSRRSDYEFRLCGDRVPVRGFTACNSYGAGELAGTASGVCGECDRSSIRCGMVGGLAGVTMLELHCPNFEFFHIILWHIAVVPVSGLVGALVAVVVGNRDS